MAKDIKLNFGNDTADVNNFMSKDDALQHFRELCISYSQSLSDANVQLNDIYSYVNDFLHAFDEISDNYTYAIADINNVNSYFEGISAEYDQLQNDLDTAYTYMNTAFDMYEVGLLTLATELSYNQNALTEVNTKVDTLESYISDMVDNNNALYNIYTNTCDKLIANTEQVYSVTENDVTKEYTVTAKINYGQVETDETITITNIDPETEEETTEEVNLYKPDVYVIMQHHDDNANTDETIVLSNDMVTDGETENSVYTLSSDGKVEVADPARTVTVTKIVNEESDDNNANGNDNGSDNGASNNGGTPGQSGPGEQANH